MQGFIAFFGRTFSLNEQNEIQVAQTREYSVGQRFACFCCSFRRSQTQLIKSLLSHRGVIESCERVKERMNNNKKKNISRQTAWAVDLFDGKLLIIIFYSLYECRCRFATTNALSYTTYSKTTEGCSR